MSEKPTKIIEENSRLNDDLDLLIEKEIITNDEMEAYADEIARNLSNLSTSKEKKAYVLNCLNYHELESLLCGFIDGRSNEQKIRNQHNPESLLAVSLTKETIKKLRKRLLFILSEKLGDDKIYLRDCRLDEPQTLLNAYGKETLLKKMRDSIENTKISEVVPAQKKLSRLPDHPNIVKILALDTEQKQAIVEKRNIVNLSIYSGAGLERYRLRSKKYIADMIAAFMDYLSAAIYLEDNGLVLGDISLQNLGIETSAEGLFKKGVFFDEEFIFEKGAKVEAYIHHPGYLSPEANKAFSQGKKIKMEVGSMIWQIGESLLDFIIDFYYNNFLDDYREKLKKRLGEQGFNNLSSVLMELKLFAEDMTKESPLDRPSLQECLARLGKIKEKLKPVKKKKN